MTVGDMMKLLRDVDDADTEVLFYCPDHHCWIPVEVKSFGFQPSQAAKEEL